MTCNGTLTRACNGQSVGYFRLAIGLIRGLCGPCLQAATQLGYSPTRVTEWVGRAADSRLPMNDMTGRAA